MTQDQWCDGAETLDCGVAVSSDQTFPNPLLGRVALHSFAVFTRFLAHFKVKISSSNLGLVKPKCTGQGATVCGSVKPDLADVDPGVVVAAIGDDGN